MVLSYAIPVGPFPCFSASWGCTESAVRSPMVISSSPGSTRSVSSWWMRFSVPHAVPPRRCCRSCWRRRESGEFVSQQCWNETPLAGGFVACMCFLQHYPCQVRNCQIKFGNNVPRGSESISYYLFHNEIGDFLNMIDPKGSRYYSIPNDRYVVFFPRMHSAVFLFSWWWWWWWSWSVGWRVWRVVCRVGHGCCVLGEPWKEPIQVCGSISFYFFFLFFCVDELKPQIKSKV